MLNLRRVGVRTLTTVLLATAVALGTSPDAASAAGPGPVAKAAASTPDLTTDVYERRVRYWINLQRTNRGLPRLRHEDCTDRVAEHWGRFLAETLAFFHQSMSGLLDTCQARYAGETLARGPIGPRRMVRLWMRSPGHRAILLSTSPRRIGIGAYPDRTGAWVVAADFTRF